MHGVGIGLSLPEETYLRFSTHLVAVHKRGNLRLDARRFLRLARAADRYAGAEARGRALEGRRRRVLNFWQKNTVICTQKLTFSSDWSSSVTTSSVPYLIELDVKNMYAARIAPATT